MLLGCIGDDFTGSSDLANTLASTYIQTQLSQKIDAVLSAQPTIQEAIKSGLPMKLVGGPVFYEPLAVAVDKGDPEFSAKVAEIVAAMRADGTLSKLSEKWYGVDYSTVK